MISFSCDGQTVELRNPANDSETVEGELNIKRSMSGRRYAYIKPVRKKFTLTFANFNARTRELLLAFLRISAGKQVKYTDPDGQIFNGRFLTGSHNVTHAAVRNHNFQVEFEYA